MLTLNFWPLSVVSEKCTLQVTESKCIAKTSMSLSLWEETSDAQNLWSGAHYQSTEFLSSKGRNSVFTFLDLFKLLFKNFNHGHRSLQQFYLLANQKHLRRRLVISGKTVRVDFAKTSSLQIAPALFISMQGNLLHPFLLLRPPTDNPKDREVARKTDGPEYLSILRCPVRPESFLWRSMSAKTNSTFEFCLYFWHSML